jgi:uncharacterized protein YprB with RNaseH-like and TPR domain
MLESTYIHCPGIGPKTERALWEAGAFRWEDYLTLTDSLRVARSRRGALASLVEESMSRLQDRDYSWFARTLPSREHWRALPAFQNRTAYLDIETTGGPDGGLVTVIGVYDGQNLRQYIRGVDLNRFPEEIEQYSTLVSFFGTGFDLPVLRRAFGIRFNQIHVDLCFLLKRLGYSGGLKTIEERFGICRSENTRGLSGFDAVRLWWNWRGGSRRALDTLLEYNAEDVVNLKVLLDLAYPMIRERTLGELAAGAALT